MIGDLLKRRGEYVEALRRLRIDYEVSAKYLPQKQLLATGMSLGEVYLRLERFKETLLYQGQALAKINVGEVLDSSGDWAGALETFEEDIRLGVIVGPTAGKDLVNCNDSKDKLDASTPIQIEESACSFKSKSSKSIADNVTEFGSASTVEISNASKYTACGSKLHVCQVPSGCLEVNCSGGYTFPVNDHGCPIMFKVGHDSIYVDMNSCLMGNILDIDYLKVEVASAFFLGLFEEKRSKGLVPVIHQLVCSGKI